MKGAGTHRLRTASLELQWHDLETDDLSVIQSGVCLTILD